MIATVKRCRQRSVPAWHAQFLTLLPRIVAQAKIAFRHLNREAKEEKVQEVVCNALAAFVRLVQLGKADIAYASPLAHYGVAQVREGRKVGGHLNIKDISSTYCQRVKGLCLQRLDHYSKEDDERQEVLIEDRRCGPFDIVRTKLDFADWLRGLSRRDRRLAEFLALGHRTRDAARKFGMSDGRVSQLRRELKSAWEEFTGEPEPPHTTAVPSSSGPAR